MRKRRGRFARLTTVFLAVLVALILTGMGYAGWSDTISFSGPVTTAVIDTELEWTGSECVPSTGGTGIGGYADGMTLHVNVFNAKLAPPDYYVYFNINNNTGLGTLPVKIDSYNIDGSYVGVVAEMIGVVIGEQLDPGGTIYDCKLHIYLTDGTNEGEYLAFTVTIGVVQWNQ